MEGDDINHFMNLFCYFEKRLASKESAMGIFEKSNKFQAEAHWKG